MITVNTMLDSKYFKVYLNKVTMQEKNHFSDCIGLILSLENVVIISIKCIIGQFK